MLTLRGKKWTGTKHSQNKAALAAVNKLLVGRAYVHNMKGLVDAVFPISSAM